MGIAEGDRKVFRDGAWGTGAKDIRTFARGTGFPVIGYYTMVGFRCAR